MVRIRYFFIEKSILSLTFSNRKSLSRLSLDRIRIGVERIHWYLNLHLFCHRWYAFFYFPWRKTLRGNLENTNSIIYTISSCSWQYLSTFDNMCIEKWPTRYFDAPCLVRPCLTHSHPSAFTYFPWYLINQLKYGRVIPLVYGTILAALMLRKAYTVWLEMGGCTSFVPRLMRVLIRDQFLYYIGYVYYRLLFLGRIAINTDIPWRTYQCRHLSLTQHPCEYRSSIWCYVVLHIQCYRSSCVTFHCWKLFSTAYEGSC